MRDVIVLYGLINLLKLVGLASVAMVAAAVVYRLRGALATLAAWWLLSSWASSLGLLYMVGDGAMLLGILIIGIGLYFGFLVNQIGEGLFILAAGDNTDSVNDFV